MNEVQLFNINHYHPCQILKIRVPLGFRFAIKGIAFYDKTKTILSRPSIDQIKWIFLRNKNLLQNHFSGSSTHGLKVGGDHGYV
jgi:hypothetical protein